MIVIADDITGAAEMAGIAFSRGHQVRLLCLELGGSEGQMPLGFSGSLCCDDVAANETLIIATDTRSMSEAEATAETHRLVAHFCDQGQSGRADRPFPFLTPHSSFLLFKKTDSALRGHVVTELSALIEATGYRRAIWVPANPSKGRIIRKGIYYVNGTPINQTDFSFDPEFPAHTAILTDRFPDAAVHGIIMPDAETIEDIRRTVRQYDDGQTLFAGAADLYTVLLDIKAPQRLSPSAPLRTPSSMLILCGSTQSKPLDIGIPVTEMPLDIYDGSSDIEAWASSATSTYLQSQSLIITIPYHHRTGREAAVHLRQMTALLTARLIVARQPEELVVEGGASAFALLQRLGWTELTIVGQLAPGVVRMRADNGVLVTLKPGSYPWGTLFTDIHHPQC